MTPQDLRNVLEAALLAAGRALSLDDFLALFEGSPDAPDRAELRAALDELAASLEGRALELTEVASGYRLQVRQAYSPWLGGLFAERPPRYSRALLETLALIAYRQPITRGEIEDVRGVVVSTNIIKTLMEREWIRVLGHREVPGRPALYGTTRDFLDHFGLKGLDGLPPLAEIRDLDQVEPDLFASLPAEGAGESSGEAAEEAAGEGAGEPTGGGAEEALAAGADESSGDDVSGESPDGEGEQAIAGAGDESAGEGADALLDEDAERPPDEDESAALADPMPDPAAAGGTGDHHAGAEAAPDDTLSLGGADPEAPEQASPERGDGDGEEHAGGEDALPRAAADDGGAGR